MPDSDDGYDVFVSFAASDRALAEEARGKAEANGLRAFLSEGDLQESAGTTDWLRKMYDALDNSECHLILWSPATSESFWVEDEAKYFHSQCLPRGGRRIILPVLVGGATAQDLLNFLQTRQRVKSIAEAAAFLTRRRLQHLQERNEGLQEQLHQTNERISKELEHFLYKKFWSPVFDRTLHIFTCARDTPHEDNNTRGDGGRTHIDKWDYQTVLDIHRFFATHHPKTQIEIEEPVSKHRDPGFELITKMDRQLRNKNCIIVGSPDVSDYCEYVLSELHSIPPYSTARVKQRGYVIIKDRTGARPSSIYWQKQADEEEGIAMVKAGGEKTVYAARTDEEGGELYGILTVARNPCSDEDRDDKVYILSGFSGIATNAIVRLLTDSKHKFELEKLDNQYQRRDPAVEILIRAKFKNGPQWRERDDRWLTRIEFQDLLYIS